MSSLNSSFIEQVNTKYEAFLLIHDPTRLMILLFSKYGDIEEDFNLLYANQLIYNLPTKLNCFYKELKYTNIPIEFLKRAYKLTETVFRIPKLSEYYKNYHQFFCRPTLRHFKLCRMICKYQDKKAELYYKNNYIDTKRKNSIIEKEEKDGNKDSKKSLSFSLSSLDNVTNNKIIFDKQTRKILDKSETELKNNNYYNTLILDSSRSNLLINNGLISKRTDQGGEDSFEKYIHSLVEYQFKKNQNKDRIKKIDKKFIKNKKLKNIIINNNNFNPNKYYNIKNNICQSHREPNKFYISKINSNNKITNNKMNRLNSNNSAKNNNNYTSKIKLKKKSLYTSSTRLLNSKNNQKISNKKEFSINYPIVTTNQNSNKNKTYIYTNSENNTINTTGINNNKNNSNLSKIFSHSNINNNKNLAIFKTLKLAQNNLKNFSKLIEYLRHSKNKENNNLTQKASLHKKNCFSSGENDHKNLNLFLKEKNRFTKKKLNINKTVKINTNANITHHEKNSRKEQKSKHIKNKTFDYNAINQVNNLTKNSNKKSNEDYNTLLNNKTKKKTFKIVIDNNNFQSSKKKFSKISKISKSKKSTFTPSSNKMVNKISVTKNGSKDKNNKKDLIFKLISPNNKKLEIDTNKEINSLQNRNYYNYIYISENNQNNINNFIYNEPMLNSSKTTKTNNFILSPNVGVGNNIKSRIPKNLDLLHISPSSNNQILNNRLFFFKKNYSNNSNKNSHNNIYRKKSINKDNQILIKKKGDKMVTPNNYKFNNTAKELNKNISLNNYNSFNRYSKPTNSLYSDNKSLSRNNKKFSCKKIINCKKSNIYKANSNSGFIGDKLKYNFILNKNHSKNNVIKNNGKGNIKISIKKNKIDIKDSILHIDKLYIKKDNFSKNNLMSRVYSDIDCSSSHRKKIDEIKVDMGGSYRIRSGKDIKANNEKINTIDYSPLQFEYSPKIINVHRNFNLIIKNKDSKNKYK